MRCARGGAKAGKLTVLVDNNNGELRARTHSANIRLMNDKLSLEPDPKERLSDLIRLEASAVQLREKVVELEVDHITAQTALEHTQLTRIAGMDVKVAAAIVLTVERYRELPRTPGSREPTVGIRIEHYRLGLSALREWVAAGEPTKTQGGSGLVKGVFALIALLVVGAGLVVHWALLILLLPIGASSVMMWSGNDAGWRRVAAWRRFEQSGLAPPAGWEMKDVQAHIRTLEEKTDAISEEHSLASESGSTQQLGGQADEALHDVEQSLLDLLGSVGLTNDSLDAETERELRMFSRPFIVKRELAAARSKLARVRREADLIRNELYRYLRRRGVGPAEGQADIASLTDAVNRLGDEVGHDASS